jgi:hypothetical protein
VAAAADAAVRNCRARRLPVARRVVAQLARQVPARLVLQVPARLVLQVARQVVALPGEVDAAAQVAAAIPPLRVAAAVVEDLAVAAARRVSIDPTTAARAGSA